MPHLHALVPVKDVVRGKSRLAQALPQSPRAQLIRTMLESVVDAAIEASAFDAVSVLTGDPSLVPPRAGYLADPGPDLNAALTSAAHALSRAGAQVLVIIAADLPFATAGDLSELAAASRGHGIVAAPDWQDAGTNALAIPLSAAICGGFLPTRFGPGSLAAHRAAALAARLPWSVVRRGGLAFDVDEPAQLESLVRQGGERYAFISHARAARSSPGSTRSG